MNCPFCGNANLEGAKFCSSCGKTLDGTATTFSASQPIVDPSTPKVPDYLIPAIIETVCCCLPLGIASLYYAVQARNKAAAGNYADALTAATSAKTYFWIGLVVGLMFAAIFGIFYYMGGTHHPKFR